MPFSRGYSQPRDRTQVTCIAGGFITVCATKEAHHPMTSPDGHYQNQVDYIFCSQRWRSSYSHQKIRPGADSGSDHEFLISKFRLKSKKVGKTTRLFRYHLIKSLTVEVRNRFKGFHLIDRVPEEVWMEVHKIVWEVVIKAIPKKMKCKKGHEIKRCLFL